MKQLLLALLLFAGYSGISQNRIDSLFNPGVCEIKGDTLILIDWKQVKFIRIGDKTYRITSPELQEVITPKELFINIWGGNSSSPNMPLSELLDSSYNRRYVDSVVLKPILKKK